MKGGLRINPGLYLSILGVYLVLQPAKYLALLQHYLFWEIPQPDLFETVKNVRYLYVRDSNPVDTTEVSNQNLLGCCLKTLV